MEWMTRERTASESHQESKGLMKCIHSYTSFGPWPPSSSKATSESTKTLRQQRVAWMYSQVTMNESIDLRHVLMIDPSQNDNEENHHKRWKPPAQKAKEQVSPFGVFIIHHQHVPEVHRLGKETIQAGAGLMVQDKLLV